MILTDGGGGVLPERGGTRGTVVVPSFGRPGLLDRCLAALHRQVLAPDEILVVGRKGDDATREVASDRAVFLAVSAPGHLPPLAAGVRAAEGDVVCFVDDDAEPWPEWTASLLRHYRDERVGGVGGLVSQPDDPQHRIVADEIGILRGNRFDALRHERIPRTWEAREVEVLRGTNMSFRRMLLARYPWDGRLNRGAATDFEVDLCSWVRREGFRVVYDPEAIVTHRPGPRPELGRASSPAAIASYSHNIVYVSGKALPLPRALLSIAGAFLVGSRGSYGLATAAADTLLGRRPSWRGEVQPALNGKLEGVASLAAFVRRGNEPLES